MALANATFPVYIFCLSQRTLAIRRNEALDMELAISLMKMHDGHDQDPLPLVEDYNDPNLQYRTHAACGAGIVCMLAVLVAPTCI